MKLKLKAIEKHIIRENQMMEINKNKVQPVHQPFKIEHLIGLWIKLDKKDKNQSRFEIQCNICNKIEKHGHIKRHLKIHQAECTCKIYVKRCTCVYNKIILLNKDLYLEK